MSEESLFDTTAFAATSAVKSARKRAAKTDTSTAARAESAPAAKRKKTPRTIAEALLANQKGEEKAKAVKAAPVAPKAKKAAKVVVVPVQEAPPVKEAAKRPARNGRKTQEPKAGGPATPAPGREADMHATLAAAAQSVRQTAAVPAAPIESAPAPAPAPVVVAAPVVAAAPVATPERAVGDAPRDQPQQSPHPHHAPGGVEGQPPRERFSRRQRWKERRAREREQRAARGGEQGQGGGGSHPSHSHPHSSAEAQSGDRGEREREPEKPLGPPEPAEGILELSPKGHGFLRLRDKLFAQLPQDVFVHGDMIRKHALREGMFLAGQARRNSRGLQLTEVSTINGRTPDELKDLPLFEELKATNPCRRYQLETTKERMTTRVIDMLTPVGRGQRGLIVAPPRAGKTTLLQHVAEAMVANYPNVHLMILLVDERPEEVTEFRRVLPQAEIFASSNDSDVKSHTRIAQFAIERAKRLVEMGDHVFMLMDSITRLARAFNNANSKGATGSGGMGVGSMEIPRRLFAAARNTKTAGSLTVLATALVETGSRMDDVIFAEFKGTGNMELVLDRKIAEQFIFPAVNIFKSGTRREELLLPAFQIEKIHMLRRGLAGHKPIEAVQRVLSLLERYPNNAQMLLELPSK